MKRYIILLLLFAASGYADIHDLSNLPLQVDAGSAASPGVFLNEEGEGETPEGERDGFYDSAEGEDGIGVSVDATSVGKFLSTGWNGAVVGNQVGTLSFPAGSEGSPSIFPTGDTNTGIYSGTADTLKMSTGGTLRLTLSDALLTSTLPIVIPVGGPTAPSIYHAGDPNTGLYSAAADTLNLTTGGTLRLTLNTAALTSTLPYLAPNGSAAAAAYDFSGDAGNGMYLSAANTVSWSTDGTLRLSLSTSDVTSTLPFLTADGTEAAPAFGFSGDAGNGMYLAGADTIGFSTGGTLRLSASTTAVTSTLPIVFPVGAAATPSITFTGDLNTGIYWKSADDFRFVAGGVEKLTINSAGAGASVLYTASGGSAAAPALDISGLSGYGLYQTGAVIGVSVVGASIVNWSADTMLWDVDQYNDANVGALVLKTGGTLPGTVEWKDNDGDNTGIYTLGFAVNEEGSGVIEIPHDYKEGTDLTFHVHFGINDPPTGTDNVKWALTYAVAHNGDTLADATTIYKETAIDTQYQTYRSDFTAITGTSFTIGDQFMFTLKRVTADGDAFTGEVLVNTIGFHYVSNTLGSASITSK